MGKKLSTAVFVDYENFYITKQVLKSSTDIDDILQEIKKDSAILHLAIYADFNKNVPQAEKIRLDSKYPNKVRECSSYSAYQEKDLTDFYLLDDIYQTLITNPTIEQFILITGDGHFHSVVVHLRLHHDKKVGVIAFKGSLSARLRDNADWFRELEPNYDFDFSYVLNTLYFNEKNQYHSFFKSVVDNCSQFNKVDPSLIKASLEYLIANEYVLPKIIETDHGERRVLTVDWEKVESNNIWKRVV